MINSSAVKSFYLSEANVIALYAHTLPGTVWLPSVLRTNVRQAFIRTKISKRNAYPDS